MFAPLLRFLTLAPLCLVVGVGCTKSEKKPTTQLEPRTVTTPKKSAPKLAKPEVKPRPLPACLEGIEGLTEPQRSAAADDLAKAHASLFAAKGPRSPAQLERACTYSVDAFELTLRHAVHEHRELLASGREDEAAWVEVERRWKALASRGVQMVDTCRETVPGSSHIGHAVQLALRAQVGANRHKLAEASMRRLLRYYPDRVDEIAACFDGDELTALRAESQPADPNPLTTDPWPTKVPACDEERKARLCTLRGRLPRDEAEAMALLDEPPKNMVDPKDCKARHEKARAALATTNWCYRPTAHAKRGGELPRERSSGPFSSVTGAADSTQRR